MDIPNFILFLTLAAIAVSVSVLPIVTVILILLSKNSVKNSFGYLIGWVLALTIVTTICYSLIDNFAYAPERPDEPITIVMKVLMGLILILMARHLWTTRPESSEDAAQSKVFDMVDDLTFIRSLLLGFLLLIVNFKNLFLILISTYTLSEMNLARSIQTVLLTVFIGFSSLTILIPVIFNAAMGEKIKPTLNSTKDWLLVNNKAVLAVMLFAAGSLLIIQNTIRLVL
jgi:hypothetical protein